VDTFTTNYNPLPCKYDIVAKDSYIYSHLQSQEINYQPKRFQLIRKYVDCEITYDMNTAAF